MALAYRTRKRLAILILLVGMPLYIVAAVTVVGLFDRPPLWVEFLVYVGLGLLWIAPLRAIFRGIGQADPETKKAEGQGPSA